MNNNIPVSNKNPLKVPTIKKITIEIKTTEAKAMVTTKIMGQTMNR